MMNTVTKTLLLVAVLLAGCEKPATRPLPPLYEVRIGEASWQVELAITESQQQLGLARRNHLPDGRGMLFLYDKPRMLKFWMKGCWISLDIAFIDADGKIVSIHTMTHQPPETPDDRLKTYASNTPAQFALEVPANAFKTAGVQVGDTVVFDPRIPIPTHGR